ncbi:MAG TPA: DUF1800 domain-containing protein [Daejeonella sp.]|nr:DUF1800 domain-containing protein [Daejeonella sp.]
MPDSVTLNNLKHLYSRAAFGINYPDLQNRSNLSINQAVEELFHQSKTYEALDLGISSEVNMQVLQLSEQERRERMRTARQNIQRLNLIWLEKMASSEAMLREKMTLFWHGHFACRSNNPVFLQALNNVHRQHGLGNFKTLLLEVSRSPAMLQFLNNQQNRKGRPNENFARELMELFTLGRGNYTEQDIKEAARAFTGWGFRPDGQFQFRELLHDRGTKAFMGHTGNWDGQDIIDHILKKPQAAEFIARKLYIFLVNDQADEQRVKELGAYFYQNNYDISRLLKKILTSDWFYAPENVGSKIKSPIELLVGLNRQFKVQYQNPAVLLQFQNALGQVLFFPPNVAGWSGGRNWIDSSSLMLRLKIPSLVLNAGIIDFDGKADIEDEALIALNQIRGFNIQRRVQARADWNKFTDEFPVNFQPQQLANFLLQTSVNPEVLNLLQKNTTLKSAAIELVSMPEYQMC